MQNTDSQCFMCAHEHKEQASANCEGPSEFIVFKAKEPPEVANRQTCFKQTVFKNSFAGNVHLLIWSLKEKQVTHLPKLTFIARTCIYKSPYNLERNQTR